MQLDIFTHSRDVMLRNDVVDALKQHDELALGTALKKLMVEFPDDGLHHDGDLLYRWLHTAQHIPSRLDVEQATYWQHALQHDITPVAQRVLSLYADQWLQPYWRQLAAAMQSIAFNSHHDSVHAVPIWLRLADWTSAQTGIAEIPAWRHQATPLAWMIMTLIGAAQIDAMWPLLAELCWLAPQRAQQVVVEVKYAPLISLIQRFDAAMDDTDDGTQWRWFPAWALITMPGLQVSLRHAQADNQRDDEQALHTLLALFSYERQGRHENLIAERKKLRALHAGLFALYMASR